MINFFFISNTCQGSVVVNHSKNSEIYSYGISIFGSNPSNLKYSKNFNNFEYVNPLAPKGGEIKYGIEGTFNSLNPFILKGIPAIGMEMVFDTLMESSADEISSKYGLVAQSVKISADKKSITFNLRKSAKFHDGSKINADDVVFSFYILKEQGHPSYSLNYRDVLEVKKINDYLVKFILKNGNNKQLPLAIASLPILSKKYYSHHIFNQTTFEEPLGSGPYQVSKVDAGKSITFKRVNNYWAKDLPVNVGRYNFDQIKYDYYRDNNVLIEAFKAGNYDFRLENIARNWANAYNIDKVKNGQIIKREIDNNLPSPMQAFVFNLRKEKFQNRNLREAIALTFDFEWLRKKIFYDSYFRTESFFQGSEFASKNFASREELKILNKFKNDIPKSVFIEKFQLPKTEGSGFCRDNLLKAKKLLQDAGYFIDNQKLIDIKSGKPLEIEFLIDNKAFQMVVAHMIKNLSTLGIKAKVRIVNADQYQNRIKNYNYDIIIGLFVNGLVPSDEQFSYWHSSQKDIIGGNNFSGLNNKAVDYLVEAIVKSNNKKELEILTKCLDRILLANFYVIPHWHSKTYRILYQNKFAMPKNHPPYSLSLDTWWQK